MGSIIFSFYFTNNKYNIDLNNSKRQNLEVVKSQDVLMGLFCPTDWPWAIDPPPTHRHTNSSYTVIERTAMLIRQDWPPGLLASAPCWSNQNLSEIKLLSVGLTLMGLLNFNPRFFFFLIAMFSTKGRQLAAEIKR